MMDFYHAFFGLKPGVSDMQLAAAVEAYMGHLRAEGLIVSYRLTRAKLGFGLRGHGDWHIVMEVRDLAQLQTAFDRAASRAGPIEGFHFGVNSLVQTPIFALYRDFPDPVRQQGEERF